MWTFFSFTSSVVVPLSEEERQEKQKQAELRAKFVQELLLSTLESKKWKWKKRRK